MKQNRSVIRILSILELLSQHPEGLTLAEIYRALDMPKATAYDFLQTLYQADAVYYKNPQLKNYVIGAKMYSIGSVYTRDSNLIAASSEMVEAFAEKYGQTVFITKRYAEKIVYVYKYKAEHSIISIPLNAGSTTTTTINDVVRDTYTYFDDHAPFFKVFSGQINNLDYIEALSLPIFNFENRCIGAIVTCDFMNKENNKAVLINDFTKIAQEVAQKLGYKA